MKQMDVSGIHHDVGKATTPDEFHRIALTVAFALSNPCKFHHYFTYMWFILQSDQTDWDVERLADRVKNTRPQEGDANASVEDKRLAKYFKNPQFGEFDEPATVIDRHGRIILWYLPLIISVYRMVCIFSFLSTVLNMAIE